MAAASLSASRVRHARCERLAIAAATMTSMSQTPSVLIRPLRQLRWARRRTKSAMPGATKKCPSAVNTTDVGACVTPARHAAEASLSSTFGHVHEDHARSIHLRGVKSNNASCMWRQTGNCDAKGPREAERDQGCEAVIEAGLSGFCECTAKDSSGKKIKSRGWEASCSGRFPFTCQLACLGKQPASLCAWRQTGGCDPSGTREPDNDKRCGSMVPAGASGFCECGIDHRHTYKRTCDGEETFACIEACSSLLFEDAETAAAADSSEAEI